MPAPVSRRSPRSAWPLSARFPLAVVISLALSSSSVIAAPDAPSSDAEATEPAATEASDTPASDAPATPSMTADQARVLDDAARKSFDAGEYGQAAADWDRAVRNTEETQQDHLERYSYTTNAVTSYQQVFVISGDTEALAASAALLRVYLQQCEAAYGARCSSLDETKTAREQLREADRKVLEHQVPPILQPPPEEGLAIGGRPLDQPEERIPMPPWAYATLIVGAGIAAGGTAMIVHGTNDKFQAADDTTALAFYGGGIGDTDGSDSGDTSGDTDGTPDSGSTGVSIDISEETKGKLLLGFGGLVAAIGVGLIVHGAIVIGKNRRLNRRRDERLAVQPTFGTNTAGLSVSGRF